MNLFSRAWRHLFAPSARGSFPDKVMDDIQALIARGEKEHDAQICFAVESRMSLEHVLSGYSTRQRAEEAFVRLRVWDTEDNTGVLIYLLLADHAIEIVTDRKVTACVSLQEWDAVHAVMSSAFADKNWREGALRGIEATHHLLARHLPRVTPIDSNELPDRPVIL